MKDVTATTQASRKYAAAYSAQYTEKDLRRALPLYRSLVTEHPDTPEAGYAQTQLYTIVKSVVPAQALLEAQIELAFDHFPHEGPVAPERGPVASPGPEPTAGAA